MRFIMGVSYGEINVSTFDQDLTGKENRWALFIAYAS